MDADAFRREKRRFGHVVPSVMSRARVLEIDEPEDLRLAETMVGARQDGRSVSAPEAQG